MTGENALILTDAQLDRLAELLAVKLAQVKPATPAMLTVEDVCITFQVSRAWVYENAFRLGGVKLGPSRRAPLRFDREKVAAALDPLGRPDRVDTREPRTGSGRRGRRHLHPVYDG
jgi:hypothetical protein